MKQVYGVITATLIIPVSVDLFVRSEPWKQGHSNVFWAAALKPERKTKKQKTRNEFHVPFLVLPDAR